MTTKRSSWGSIRRLPSKRYQASYSVDGRRYTAPYTFDNKGDAQEELRRIGGDVASGRWVSPDAVAAKRAEAKQTLEAFAADWLRPRDLRPRTVDEYRRLLAGPLSPLTPMAVTAITSKRVSDWYSDQVATGKKTQASRAYGLLNTIMKYAVKHDVISKNPCVEDGAQSRSTGRQVTPPTDVELETIIESITPRYRALVIVAAVGGLRYGEATALRARDVTVERDDDGAIPAVRIDVSRGVVRTAGGIVAGSTKTAAGVRKVAIFGQDAALVAEHARGLIGDALLFPAADGVSFLSQSAFWKHWNAARGAAGRPDMPFHALRHYAGTRYAQAGATPRETMARLGHSSIGAAMRYQHAGNRDDELAARMSRRSS